MQIRTKLTLQFIFITASIFALALWFIYARFRQLNENEFYTLLESKARMTAEMVLHHEDELKPLPDKKVSGTLPYGENLFIFDSIYRCVFALNPAGEIVPSRQIEMLSRNQDFRFPHGKMLAFGATVYAKSGRKYISVSEQPFQDEELMKLRNIMILSFFLIVGIVASGGWFYAGEALRPVSRIVKEVDRILPSDLSKRVKDENQKDEISHLVSTFNRLLDRIEQAFQMQKNFISNVSHELKNPLASMDAQLQLVLQKDRSSTDYRDVLESLHDDVHEITNIAEKLLQLAKIHSDAPNIVFSNVRLDEVLLQTRDQIKRLHPDYNIVLEMKNMPEEEHLLLINGNEPLLKTALINLIDNGCKFSPDKKVNIRMLFCVNGFHQIEITDKGPGIPEEDLQRIFQPFFRSRSHSHIKGSGIGLSLVQSILGLHQIAIAVFSEKNLGSTFRLSFPVPATI